MKKLLLTLALLSLPCSAIAQVAILDASANSGEVTVFGSNTQTYSAPISAGSNRVAVFSVAWQNTAIATAISTITWGTTQTPAACTNLAQDGGVGVRLYFLTESQISNGTVSGNNLVIVWNDTPDRAVVSRWSYSNATTCTGGVTASGSTSATATASPTGGDANSAAVAGLTSGNSATINTGTTDFINVGGKFAAGAHTAVGSSTLIWNVSNTDSYAAAGGTITSAGGGGGSVTNGIMMSTGMGR